METVHIAKFGKLRKAMRQSGMWVFRDESESTKLSV